MLFCAGMLRSEVAALRSQDVELTSTPEQVRVRVRTNKTNPAAEREDYRLTVNGFDCALEALPSTTDPQATDGMSPRSPD